MHFDPAQLIYAAAAAVGLYAAHRKGVKQATDSALGATRVELEAYKSRSERNSEEIADLQERLHRAELKMETLHKENATLRSAISPGNIEAIVDRSTAVMVGRFDTLAAQIEKRSESTHREG